MEWTQPIAIPKSLSNTLEVQNGCCSVHHFEQSSWFLCGICPASEPRVITASHIHVCSYLRTLKLMGSPLEYTWLSGYLGPFH